MSSQEEKKFLIEKRAMRLSFIGSALFTIAELVMFFTTRSHAILMDCIFDSVELILIGPLLLLIPLLYKPVTEKHPSLFIVSVVLIIQNINVIMHGGNKVPAGNIAGFEFSVFGGCFAMYLGLLYLSRKYTSMTIQAELYMWRVDVFSSLGVALAFLLTWALNQSRYAGLTPYLDPVIAIVLTCFLLVEPVRLINQNIHSMLLLAPPKDVMDEVREISTKALSEYDYELKFLDVIQTGRKTWVELYIDSGSSRLDLRELHEARNEIREQLKGKFDQVYIELIPDLPEV
jgi:predicted Co/Zn/Cd cation transporter (cation efflux family)